MLQNYDNRTNHASISGEICPILHRFRPKSVLFGRNLPLFYEISPETGLFGAFSLSSSLRFFSLILCMILVNIAQSTKNATTPMTQTLINCTTPFSQTFVIPVAMFWYFVEAQNYKISAYINNRCEKKPLFPVAACAFRKKPYICPII